MLAYTRRGRVMIGRAAQGRPWIFREIAHFLATGAMLACADGRGGARRRSSRTSHDHYAFYGEAQGVRIARKHLHWYTERAAGRRREFRHAINAVESVAAQIAAVERFFARLAARWRAVALRRAQRRSRVDDGRSAARSRTRGARELAHGGTRGVKKSITTEQQQRNRPQRREFAGRILPPARRRAAAWHLRHGDRACRARAARRRSSTGRTATRRTRPTCWD